MKGGRRWREKEGWVGLPVLGAMASGEVLKVIHYRDSL